MSVSLFDMTVGQQTELMRMLAEGGMEMRLTNALLKKPEATRTWVRELRGLLKMPPLHDSSVGFSLKLVARIKSIKLLEEGNYDRADDMSDLRIGRDSGVVRAALIWFKEAVTPEQVEQSMSEDGLRPATMKELLCFGAQYPDQQLDRGIVELGTKYEKEAFAEVGLLYASNPRNSPVYRFAEMIPARLEYDTRFKFLAIEK